MKDYKIVYGYIPNVEKEVKELLNDGWELAGPAIPYNEYLSQTMVYNDIADDVTELLKQYKESVPKTTGPMLGTTTAFSDAVKEAIPMNTNKN